MLYSIHTCNDNHKETSLGCFEIDVEAPWCIPLFFQKLALLCIARVTKKTCAKLVINKLIIYRLETKTEGNLGFETRAPRPRHLFFRLSFFRVAQWRNVCYLHTFQTRPNETGFERVNLSIRSATTEPLCAMMTRIDQIGLMKLHVWYKFMPRGRGLM